MEKEKLMEKEIEEKRKITDDVKKKIDNEVFYNFLLAVVIMTYMFFINFGFLNLNIEAFKIYIKILTLIIASLTIFFFELSYRKDNLKYTLTGIELLVCATIVVYIPYIYMRTNKVIKQLVMLVPLYYGVYYSIKNYIIYKREVFKYQNNLSDVKEIVKNEEESYLEEDSKKLLKEIKKMDDLRKQEEKMLKEKKKQQSKQVKQKIKNVEEKIKEDKKVIKKDINKSSKKGSKKND